MSTLMSNLMGRVPYIHNWRTIGQYVAIGVSPLLLIAGVFLWQNAASRGEQSQVLSITSSQPENPALDGSKSSESGSVTIFIDISGAVNIPGLKKLAKEARVNDAIWSAGGYTLQADTEYLAQVLNLAQPLKDGDKIYIPTYSEVAKSLPKPPILLNKVNEPIGVLSQAEVAGQATNGSQGEDSDNQAKININTASQSQLEELPGIGEVNAKNIIEGRPYTSTNELCSRKVITSSATCTKIQDLITL